MTKLEFELDDKTYYVRLPNQRDMNDADLVYKTKYSEAVRYGALTAAEAHKIIEDRKIFGKEDQEEIHELFMQLHKLGDKLMGTDKFAEAADTIFDMEKVRTDIMRINMKKNNILDNTAESYADEHRLQFYTVSCSFHVDDQHIFKDVDNYLERAEESIAQLALTKMIHLIANDGKDFRADWPEFQWRIKHGLMDEDLTPNQEKLDAAMAEAEKELKKSTAAASKKRVAKKSPKKVARKKAVAKK